MPSGNNPSETIVLDSSILYALLLEETGFEQYVSILNSAGLILMGAPTLAETGLIIQSRQGTAGLAALIRLLDRWNVKIVDFTSVHAMEAIEAHQRFGRGHHPARLNMGDCNSYAVAKIAGAPLLYKGGDFSLTDLPRPTPTA
ncbi:MAG: type II toxin-antitoxin system VapC family toxin [Acidobacteria bacterium]|nr:type II toxin-antitoxin system VapC family toxin [Acidobacteriota bacterium]